MVQQIIQFPQCAMLTRPRSIGAADINFAFLFILIRALWKDILYKCN